MIIKNGSLLTREGDFDKRDLHIEGEQISESSSSHEVLDASGLYILPGLVDLHFHGCFGHDFCDGTDTALTAMAEYEAQNGITAICPASMTLGDEELEKIFKNAADYAENPSPKGADFVGINMEGPYVAASKKGAQNGLYLHAPEVSHFHRMNEYSGNRIKLCTLAPELPQADSFIRELAGKVSISLGHTAADYDTALNAFQNGASHVTHLYNAMNPSTHRNPSILGAARDSEHVTVELICDGIHIHPAVIRSTFAMFGDDRICLISDSMMATGLSDGDYSLGGQAVKVTGSTATLADGTIAGSATNLFCCMKKAVSFGIPLASAVKCASENPAKKLGIFEHYGSLCTGKYANIILVDKDITLKHVILRGKLLF